MDEKKSDGIVPVVTGDVVTAQQLEDAGLMMPIANPAALRAAFEHRQRVLTSILDPEQDFLYALKYTDREGKQRQTMYTSKKAVEAAQAHMNSSGGAKSTWSAHPKKSGVLKLAHALGIESKVVSVKGLPDDPKATYSACTFIARHRRTGREEEGQGYCDKAEQPNRQNHAIISMANTRAYCHAVLRCAGYDNVGADEMNLDDSAGATVVTTQIQTDIPPERVPERAASLPSSTTRQTLGDVMPTVTVREAPATVTVHAVTEAPSAAPPADVVAPKTAAATEPAPSTTPATTMELPPDAITNAMAQELSALLLAKMGSRPKAQEWLLKHAKVARSAQVTLGQFAGIKKLLEEVEVP